jgi:hypothetical protein
MKRIKRKVTLSGFMPTNEFDFVPYRDNYEPDGHFDSQADSRDKWRDNPHRFLLVGLPQIGKTGAFLHLIYLLWEQIAAHDDDPSLEEPDEIVPAPLESAGSTGEARGEGACPCHPIPNVGSNMGKYPCFLDMQAEKFRDHVFCPDSCRFQKHEKVNDHGNHGCPDHAPGYGKYGDPKQLELWEHNVVNKLSGCHPSAHKYSSASVYPPCSAPPASAPVEPELEGAIRSSELAVSTATSKPQGKLEKHRFLLKPWSESYPSKSVLLRKFTMRCGDMIIGVLHIPECDIGEGGWWSVSDANTVHMNNKNAADELCFPIFMPTYGREVTGRLDLRKAMRKPISLQPIRHLQILVVKPGDEYDRYRAKFPQLAIYELPQESLDLGIGDARFCIQHLADQICQEGMMGGGKPERFCFVLDDSTLCWVGLTLPDDPLDPPMFGKLPKSKQQYSEVSLGQVLLYLQAADFTDRHKFAAIGFHRRSHGRLTRSFARAHVYSALFLNIGLLKDKKVFYDRRVWTWEDLDFNRRASDEGMVLCKAYRFQQQVDQIRTGGCVAGVARPVEVPTPVPAPTAVVPQNDDDDDGERMPEVHALSENQVLATPGNDVDEQRDAEASQGGEDPIRVELRAMFANFPDRSRDEVVQKYAQKMEEEEVFSVDVMKELTDEQLKLQGWTQGAIIALRTHFRD